MKQITPPISAARRCRGRAAGRAVHRPRAGRLSRRARSSFIVGQAAGSSSDITARLIAQWLSDKLGQQFVVETRPGAAGNIATEFVTRAPADGYTLLLVNAQNTINAALYEKLNFDFLSDIAPVGGIDLVPLVMEVNPSVPAKTVPEFIAYAKANPGKINMASAGIGGPQHVAGELFKSMAGVDMTHVPYRGSTPAVTDLVAGQVQVMFDVTPTARAADQGRQAARACGDHDGRARRAARPAADRRFREGLRGERLDRHRRARRARRPRSSRRSTSRSTPRCPTPTIKKRLADSAPPPMPPMTPAEFGQDDGRRRREVDQGDQVGRHQAECEPHCMAESGRSSGNGPNISRPFPHGAPSTDSTSS